MTTLKSEIILLESAMEALVSYAPVVNYNAEKLAWTMTLNDTTTFTRPTLAQVIESALIYIRKDAPVSKVFWVNLKTQEISLTERKEDGWFRATGDEPKEKK